LPTFTLAILLIYCFLATLIDLRWRKIPNVLTVSAALVGLALAFATGGLPAMGNGLLGLLTGLVLFLPGFMLRMTGGGDVKFMAACGAFLGPFSTLYAFLLYVLAAVLWAGGYGFYAWYFKGASPPLRRYWPMVRTFFLTGQVAYVRPTSAEAMGQRVPMAPAIAFGTAAAALFFPT